MKKFTRLLVMTWVVIAAMTACQDEETVNTSQEMVAVSIGVQPEIVAQSRADDATLNIPTGYSLRYVLEAWVGDKLYLREIANVAADATSTSTTFNLNLLSGRQYDILLWADFTVADTQTEDYWYNTNADDETKGLRMITKKITDEYETDYPEKTNYELAETRDAFYKHLEVNTTGGTTITENVLLTRAVAQLNLYATDYSNVTSSFLPSYTYVTLSAPTSFDVKVGAGSSTTSSWRARVQINPTTETKKVGDADRQVNKLFTSYYFTTGNKDVVNFTAKFYNTESTEPIAQVPLNNIPLQENYRTNVYGSLLTTAAEFTVDCLPNYQGKEDVDTNGEPVLPSAPGLYYSLDGGDWTLWTNNAMPDGTYTSFVVKAVGTTDFLTPTKQKAIALKTDLEFIDLSGTSWNNLEYWEATAMNQNTQLREFRFPKDFLDINNNFFKGCTNLRKVELPEGMTKIRANAFQGCTSLASVELPNSITKMGDEVFKDCSSLKTVNMEDAVGLTEIPNRLFINCTDLSDVALPTNLTKINESAFENCSSLTEIEIPSTVTAIGVKSFKNSGLSTVVLPTDLETVGMQAFYGCKKLSSVTIPDGVTSIAQEVFRGSGLQQVEMTTSLTTLGIYVFAENHSLREAIFKEGTTDWSPQTGIFHDCESLTKVSLPSNTKDLKNLTFWGCLNLADIYCYASEPPTAVSGAFGGINSIGFDSYVGRDVPAEKRKLHIPQGATDNYEAATLSDGTENLWKTVLIDLMKYEIVEDANLPSTDNE